MKGKIIMEKQTKYIYSAYGEEFKEIMSLLKEQGINDKIEELAKIAFELVKNNNVDRTQLEMYVCNSFQFKLLQNVLNNPTAIEKLKNKEKKDDEE